MSQLYRHKETAEIKTREEWSKEINYVSLPSGMWDSDVLEAAKLEPVSYSPRPKISEFQKLVEDGYLKDSKGNWVLQWKIEPKYKEYTDSEGVTHTVQDQQNAARIENVKRLKRNKQIQIANDYNNDISILTSQYAPGESITWTKQVIESKEYIANNSATVPMLEEISTERGVDLLSLANEILFKDEQYSRIIGKAIGRRKRRSDEVEAIPNDANNAKVLLDGI